MSIGPEDIEQVVFKERFRGYDQDQVDRFLDQVAAAMAALRAERDQLAAQGGYPAPAAAPSGADPGDALISRTLSAAQRTAEEVVTEARRRAEEIVGEAQNRAQAARRQTEAEADLVRRAVSELRAFREEYRSRLHAIMSEQLAALDRAGELPRLPAAVERLAEEVVQVAPAPALAPAAPSAARTWAAAAEEDFAQQEPEPAEPEADDLASPWDGLWRGTAAAPDVQGAGQRGTDPGDADLYEIAGRDGTPPEHAGDA